MTGRTEAEISESELRFRMLLETLPHIAFVISAGGGAEYYNQRFIDYLGGVPGLEPAHRTRLHHPEDRAALDAARDAGRRDGMEYIVEARLRRHDGAYRWHRIHNKPLLRAGAAVAWLGTAVDIDDVRRANALLEERVAARTAELEAANAALRREIAEREQAERVLRESEERYRKLYNRTPLALQSVDGAARLIDVNDHWLFLFGYRRDEVLGRSPAEFMTAESAALYRDRAWPEMLASDGAPRSLEYRFRRSSGEVFDGRLSARGEFDAAGRFVRSWSAIADVTAEKRAEEQLRHALRLEAIGQLTAGVAHDFNNLLTAVLGSLEMLAAQGGGTAREARLIGTARQAAERGARLTAQLLAFARKQLLVPVILDLNAVVTGTEELLRTTLGGDCRIALALDPALWPALADPTQLELMILNLAINARDAMDAPGTITIATANAVVRARERPELPPPGEYATVAVTDTGAGMAEDVLARAFEPFFTTKDVGHGSGLGLPQVLGVTQQLGGGVAIETRPGAGTTVRIFLPRAAPSPAAPVRPRQSGARA